MGERLYIFGAGGFGREVLDLVISIQQEGLAMYDISGFLVDDEYYKPGIIVNEIPVLKLADIETPCALVLAIGDGIARKRIYEKFASIPGLSFPTIVHPRAQIGRFSRLGKGSIVCSECVLTCNINIGNFVIINLNTTIGHDCNIDDYVTINPTATISGGVNIGEAVFVGTGANILEKKTVGAGSIIGGGALVNKDVLPDVTVVGVPAHVTSTKKN